MKVNVYPPEIHISKRSLGPNTILNLLDRTTSSKATSSMSKLIIIIVTWVREAVQMPSLFVTELLQLLCH